jgi:hypothetical protein
MSHFCITHDVETALETHIFIYLKTISCDELFSYKAGFTGFEADSPK